MSGDDVRMKTTIEMKSRRRRDGGRGMKSSSGIEWRTAE